MRSVEHKKTELLVTFLSSLELAKMGFVSVYQSEVYGDIYLTAIKPIEGNVVERVEEYDSHGAEQLADSIMVDAAIAESEPEVENNFADETPVADVATDEEIAQAETELKIDGELS